MKNEINMEALAGGLEKLQPRARKRKAEQLERIREALLKARAKGVSFRALSRFFRENEVVVSEKTLRRYVREWTGAGETRRVHRVRRKRKPILLPVEKVSSSLPTPRPSWKKSIPPEELNRKSAPRLARKNPLMSDE